MNTYTRNTVLAVMMFIFAIVTVPHFSEAAGASAEVKYYAKEAVKSVKVEVKSEVTSPYNQNLKAIKTLRKMCSKAGLTQCVSDMSEYNNILRAYNKDINIELKLLQSDIRTYLKDSQADIEGVDTILTESVDAINSIILDMAGVYNEIAAYFEV